MRYKIIINGKEEFLELYFKDKMPALARGEVEVTTNYWVTTATEFTTVAAGQKPYEATDLIPLHVGIDLSPGLSSVLQAQLPPEVNIQFFPIENDDAKKGWCYALFYPRYSAYDDMKLFAEKFLIALDKANIKIIEVGDKPLQYFQFRGQLGRIFRIVADAPGMIRMPAPNLVAAATVAMPAEVPAPSLLPPVPPPRSVAPLSSPEDDPLLDVDQVRSQDALNRENEAWLAVGPYHIIDNQYELKFRLTFLLGARDANLKKETPNSVRLVLSPALYNYWVLQAADPVWPNTLKFVKSHDIFHAIDFHAIEVNDTASTANLLILIKKRLAVSGLAVAWVGADQPTPINDAEAVVNSINTVLDRILPKGPVRRTTPPPASEALIIQPKPSRLSHLGPRWHWAVRWGFGITMVLVATLALAVCVVATHGLGAPVLAFVAAKTAPALVVGAEAAIAWFVGTSVGALSGSLLAAAIISGVIAAAAAVVTAVGSVIAIRSWNFHRSAAIDHPAPASSSSAWQEPGAGRSLLDEDQSLAGPQAGARVDLRSHGARPPTSTLRGNTGGSAPLAPGVGEDDTDPLLMRRVSP